MPSFFVTEIAGAAIATQIESVGNAAETAAVGAGIGGGFKNTNELKVMKFNEAMESADKEEWMKAIDDELQKFKKYKSHN